MQVLYLEIGPNSIFLSSNIHAGHNAEHSAIYTDVICLQMLTQYWWMHKKRWPHFAYIGKYTLGGSLVCLWSFYIYKNMFSTSDKCLFLKDFHLVEFCLSSKRNSGSCMHKCMPNKLLFYLPLNSSHPPSRSLGPHRSQCDCKELAFIMLGPNTPGLKG